VAGIEDYRPYHIVSDSGGLGGLDFDVLKVILGNLGCDLEIRPLPWTRHLFELETGDVDIASPVAKTVEREAYAYFSVPYLQAQELLFVQKNEERQYASLLDFFDKGRRLGAIRSYAYGGDYDELSAKYGHLISLQDDEGPLIRQLNIGRVDAVIGEYFATKYEISKLGLSDSVVPSQTLVSEDDLYFMFSKASVNTVFVEAFNRELSRLQQNGQIDEIFETYLRN